MSNLAHNLPLLRRRAGYTQEGLAEALGVSRQAVSKWESGLTLPEAATLLTLADLLSCTLDQLMREELAEDAFGVSDDDLSAEEEAWERSYGLYERYDQHTDQFALMIALGVGLILAGVAALLFCYARLGETGLIVLPLLLCVAAAVFLFVYAGVGRENFMRQFPVIPDCRDGEEMAHAGRVFRLGLACSIAAIVADVALLVTLCVFFAGNERAQVLCGALFALVLALAVGTLVYLGIAHEKYDLEAYAKEAAKLLRPGDDLDERIEARLEAALRRAAEVEDEEDGPWSGLIMLGATILFLLAGFLFDAWHPAWILFLVGALLCGVVENRKKSGKK